MRMNALDRMRREERGSVLAMVAILTTLFLALAAFSVDFGVMFAKRRGIVNANDSAALAAALSCALGEGASAADAQADTLAAANTSGTSRGFDPIYDPSCDASAGTVTVRYEATQDMIFAPIIGIGSVQVGTEAVAKWGAVGGGAGVAPWMLSLQQTDCDIPFGIEVGDQCTFWFDNDDIGNAQWAQVNLNNWGVAANAGCSSAGTSETLSWINGGAPELDLNYPEPTFVCRDTGNAQAAITHGFNNGCPATQNNGLLCQVGKTLFFPVNDAYGEFPPGPSGKPHGQVNASGVPTPPPGSPHKYDIVGFAQLVLVSVLKGNQGGETQCSRPRDSNAWCLTLEWEGFDTGGIEPGEGGDFGVRAIGLGG